MPTCVPPLPPPSSGAAKITTRRLLAVHGADATHFLHGLTTANLRHGQTSGFYSSFLTAQGRVLNDVFIYPASHCKAYWSSLPQKLAADVDAAAYFIEVDANEVDKLLRHLKRYKLRAKVDIRAVDEGEWSVWSAWNEQEPWTPHPSPTPPSTTTDTHTDDTIGCIDARAPGMGRRLLLPTTTPISTSLPSTQETPLSAYTIRRTLRGVVEGQAEIPRETALPQEYNLDFMGGIDFRKGCYVGQELTIRTHHTGVVRKRVLPVMLYREGTPPPDRLVYEPRGDGLGAGIVAGANVVAAGRKGRPAGKWVAGAGDVGLALCRVERMTDMVLTAEGDSRWSEEDEFMVAAAREGGDGEELDGEGGEEERGAIMIKAFVPDWHRSKTKIRKPQQRV